MMPLADKGGPSGDETDGAYVVYGAVTADCASLFQKSVSLSQSSVGSRVWGVFPFEVQGSLFDVRCSFLHPSYF